ncbi:MAG: fibronectin type III domain-containing protein [Planctomycetaceae bacterium]|nr:fibronectin type III domain-containing protein [Planctomycetaceae bacterium]
MTKFSEDNLVVGSEYEYCLQVTESNTKKEFSITLLARPTSINVEATASNTISVEWQAVANATGYRIEYSKDSSFESIIGTINSSITSVTITASPHICIDGT